MKRVVSLLIVLLALNSCDDGDLIQEDISFEDTATLSCTTNNIIFKLKDKESLLLVFYFIWFVIITVTQ